MKNLKIVTTLLVGLLSAQAQAGSWSSGGGNAVVCRGDDMQIVSAELLDIFEWRDLEDIKPIKSNLPYQQQALEAAYRIESGMRPKNDKERGGNVVEKLNELFESKRLINSGLLPNQDSGHFILPKGCSVEPLARYEIPTDRLYINKEIWLALDNTHKAALMVHEAYYYHMRIFGEPDSKRVRKAVAKSFSGIEFEHYVEGIVGKEVEFCSTIDKSGPILPWISFASYKNEYGGVTIQFISLAGKMVMSKTISEIVGTGWPLSSHPDRADSFYSLTTNGTIDGDLKLFLSLQKPTAHGYIDFFNGVAKPPELKIACVLEKFEI